MQNNYLIQKANQGDAESQLNLGIKYVVEDDGYPVFINPEGIKWLGKAAYNCNEKALAIFRKVSFDYDGNNPDHVAALEAEIADYTAGTQQNRLNETAKVQSENVQQLADSSSRAKFTEYVQSGKPSLYYDKQTLNGLISDIFYDNDKLRNILKIIVSDGTSAEIADLLACDLSYQQIRIKQIIYSISEKYGIEESRVADAVHTLASGVGIKIGMK